MLWHGGDPAGWTRYKSPLVGTWFNSIGTGKIEDLRALLLRTPFIHSLLTVLVPHKSHPDPNPGSDKIDSNLELATLKLNHDQQATSKIDNNIKLVNVLNDGRHPTNKIRLTNPNYKQTNHDNRQRDKLIGLVNELVKHTRRLTKRDGSFDSFLILAKITWPKPYPSRQTMFNSYDSTYYSKAIINCFAIFQINRTQTPKISKKSTSERRCTDESKPAKTSNDGHKFQAQASQLLLATRVRTWL